MKWEYHLFSLRAPPPKQKTLLSCLCGSILLTAGNPFIMNFYFVFRILKSFFLFLLSKLFPLSQSTTNINDLPDEILSHILSFLPTKVAFRTILLSKRWIPLCHSLNVIRIDDNDIHKEQSWIHFCQFVDAVMLSQRSASLKTFHLKFRSKLWELEDDDSFSFDEWVEAVKQRSVEDLHLHLSDVALSHTIFCCKTLVVLKLREIHVPVMYTCTVDLPLLKNLHLKDILFKDIDDFTKLFFWVSEIGGFEYQRCSWKFLGC